ncbi:MAG TPA: hypothetical protein VFG76_10915, partial [Candidatus Polarisedimenticolia bacterium]|nr:hypothetical protein [Candidatus Polarisedimenticolia bacterium]
MSLRGGCFALMIVGVAALGAALPDEEPPKGSTLSVYELMTVGRLREVREVGPLSENAWNGFNPASIPMVFLDPDGGALAVGFPEPPAGFTKLDKLKEGDQVFYRAKPGVVPIEGGSPRSISGRWAVVSRVEPPAPAPAGDHLGRRSTEMEVADLVGDAFLVHLMKFRPGATGTVMGAAAYPDDPELMALTTIEQHALLAAQYMSVTEETMEPFHRVIRQLIALHHARAKLLGTDLAAVELAIENWDGLRLFQVAQVYRRAVSGTFKPVPIYHRDPTYTGFTGSLMQRLLLTNYPLGFTQDSPVSTREQVALRAGSFAFLLERLSREWFPKAIPGDRSLADLVAEYVDLKPEDEPAVLEDAKKSNAYPVVLKMAKEDLERGLRERQRLIERDFPEG